MFKKIMLITLLVAVCTGYLFANDGGDVDDELYTIKKEIEIELDFEKIQEKNKLTFEDMMSGETYIEFPLFDKVFPEAELVIQTSYITRPPRSRIAIKYEEQIFNGGFDLLYRQTHNETKSSIEDRIRLYFQLKSISKELTHGNVIGQRKKTHQFEIISIEKIEEKTEQHDCKYQVQIIYDKAKIGYFFYIKDDFFQRIELLENGKDSESRRIPQSLYNPDKQSQTINFYVSLDNVREEIYSTPSNQTFYQ